ncbi:ATP-binding protein [Cryptosporangium sp. NPDC051539]|uniref:ATP-binding protein n=1 Tax=Cryptosporangium sp. NPDC051539 TaxID=3363962 RepID=UPI0037A861E2
MARLRLAVLGPVRIERNGVQVDPGPRRQRLLLAVLLARAGQPVSVSGLVDLLWGEEVPPTAVNVVQQYVSALRRTLEPELAPREDGTYLRRRGAGYAFVTDRALVDVAEFRASSEAARLAREEMREAEALDHFLEAVRRWRGPTGGGLAETPAARQLFAALDDDFFTACVEAADLATSLDRPREVLPSLRLAAWMGPLHEPVRAALVTTLAAAGQEADARAELDSVRGRLADELGIDPGPALRAAAQRLGGRRPDVPTLRAGEPDGQAARISGLVGRADELAVLARSAESALSGGTGVIVVEGEPGVGKSCLVEEVAAGAERRGALVVWGHCLEGGGAPSMWPWIRAVAAILDALPDDVREKWRDSELGRLVRPHADAIGSVALPDSAAQFRLFELVVALSAELAARRPLVLIVDDLQWGDVASLTLFGHLAARLPAGTLLAGAFRTHAPVPGSDLTRMLAGVSRVPGHRRIRLGPLDRSAVAELVQRETGRAPGVDAAEALHVRTGGNPFYVRELARLLAGGATAAGPAPEPGGVPATVRDVVRDRMAGLPDSSRDLLQIAALIGRGVDFRLLADASGLDVRTCLELLEPVEALGMLSTAPEDPYSYRFAHDLVRESVTESTPPLRASRLHHRVADALERADAPHEFIAERLAHHLWSAGPLADPTRTADALIRAGRNAAAKVALDAAERHLLAAAQIARTAGLLEPELAALSELIAIAGTRQMYGIGSLSWLERAEHVARGLGRELEATDYLFSRWVVHAQGSDMQLADRLARQLRDQGRASDEPVVRAYGVHAWGIRQTAIGNFTEGAQLIAESLPILRASLAPRDQHTLRYDLNRNITGLHAEITALRGNPDGARTLLDAMESEMGADRYLITLWSAFSARIGALVGDPVLALLSSERGIAADPEFSFRFLGTYQRLGRCWGRAVTGQDPAGAAAEAWDLIAENLLDPPRPRFMLWQAMLAEIRMAAGDLDGAGAAIDHAESFFTVYGQRFSECWLLVLRARLLQARGEPGSLVRAAAQRAREVSRERGVLLFARRADEVLASLPVDGH